MSVPAQAASQRVRVLRALGVTPWVRRAPRAVSASVEPSVMPTDLAAGVACVVVLPETCATRELDLLGRLLNACGPTLARAARVRVSAGQLSEVPQARAYLVFGEAQAHALGRALSAAVMQRAQIVLADELAQVLTAAAAKRRLWSALRNLRRALVVAEP
jgi:DNA polymerase III psi subunit